VLDFVASYAINEIEDLACAAVKEYVDVPVCKIVKFFC